MSRWLKTIRNAAGMGLLWAVAWAPIGVLIGTIMDPNESMDEPWVLVGAYPGFLCGAILSIVLRIAEGHRRFDEWEPSRAAGWGAVAGLLVCLIPFVFASQNTNGRPAWLLPVALFGSVTPLSAISAAVSVVLTKWRRAASTRHA